MAIASIFMASLVVVRMASLERQFSGENRIAAELPCVPTKIATLANTNCLKNVPKCYHSRHTFAAIGVLFQLLFNSIIILDPLNQARGAVTFNRYAISSMSIMFFSRIHKG